MRMESVKENSLSDEALSRIEEKFSLVFKRSATTHALAPPRRKDPPLARFNTQSGSHSSRKSLEKHPDDKDSGNQLIDSRPKRVSAAESNMDVEQDQCDALSNAHSADDGGVNVVVPLETKTIGDLQPTIQTHQDDEMQTEREVDMTFRPLVS